MKPLLTISIAAYNVESYLSKLLDTILEAECNEYLQVLIVNDGSKDHTVEIAEKYSGQYPDTIYLVNKPNGGHGSTINKGINHAKGKYFKAIDGDDWFDSEGLKALVHILENSSEEVILSPFKDCYEDGRQELETTGSLKPGVYAFDDIAHQYYMRYHAVTFRTDILLKHSVHLDEHCFYVDSEYVLYPVPYLNKVRITDKPVYCYRLGLTGQSVSFQSRVRHIDDSEKVSYSLLNFYDHTVNTVDTVKKQYMENGISNHLLWHFRSLMFMKKGRRRLKKFDMYIRNNYPQLADKMQDDHVVKRDAFYVKACRHTDYLMDSIYVLLKKQD